MRRIISTQTYELPSCEDPSLSATRIAKLSKEFNQPVEVMKDNNLLFTTDRKASKDDVLSALKTAKKSGGFDRTDFL